MPAATALAPTMTRADLQDQVRSLKSQLKQAGATTRDIVAAGAKRMNAFVREGLPDLAMYAGGGALIGGLLGYFLYDRALEYFGADSWLGRYGVAIAGGLIFWQAPKIVKVSKVNLEKTAQMQLAVRGFAIGLFGAGGYRAYLDYSAQDK